MSKSNRGKIIYQHPDMEWKAEEYDCIQMYLNDIKAPTCDKDGRKYSAIGRIKQLVKLKE